MLANLIEKKAKENKNTLYASLPINLFKDCAFLFIHLISFIIHAMKFKKTPFEKLFTIVDENHNNTNLYYTIKGNTITKNFKFRARNFLEKRLL